MLKSILIGLLMIYILIGSFLTVPKMVKQRSDVLVLMVFILVCLSLYLDETLIALLAIIAIIVYVYSLDSKSRMNASNKPKQYKLQRTNQILEKESVTTETLVNEEANKTEKCLTNKPVEKKNFHGNLKTQSNIFNKLNYDLYYNELGDQFNIQGFDDVKGFDKTIYI